MRFLHPFLMVVLFAALFSTKVQAQYVTPGNNLSLSLDQLVSLSGGVVSFSNNTYFVNSALTIAATDTLRINQPAVVRVASGIRIEVSGTIISDPVSGMVYFTAIDTTTASTNFRGFRFDNSQGNVFRNTDVSYGGGLQLIASSALFEYSSFRKNGSSNVSAVITYSASSPIIRYCLFYENARSAIGSGANVTGSPHIIGNILIRNTTDNSNRPQINIGPGAADSIYIISNYIEGFYTMAGGIGISNLLSTGSTKAVVRDNYVVNNRYGYAQIGNNISSVITDNYFGGNNIQGLPASGGSGINFQASGSGNTAIVRRNIITGNLWGVTIQSSANPNFGTANDPGGNIFYENGNTGDIFALYNNTALPVTAIGNYWGTNDPLEAEAYIFHQPDQASLGLVTYLPILELHPNVLSFAFLPDDNPTLTTAIFGTIDQNDLTITATVPAGTDLTQLVPQITLPFGVASDPNGGIPTDFSAPVVYEVLTPHGQSASYTVTVSVEQLTYSLDFVVLGIGGQAVTDAVISLNGTPNPAGNYNFSQLLPGSYYYQITHPAYNTLEATVEITDQNLSITAQLTPLSYQLSFVVLSNAGQPITDAVVTLNGTAYPAGVYVFENQLPGTYTYALSREGYQPVEGTVEIVAENVQLTLVLNLIVYDVLFVVNNQYGSPVEEAQVVLQGFAPVLTAANGQAVIANVAPGTYSYTVSKINHASQTGSVQLVNQPVTVNVELPLTTSLAENSRHKLKIVPNPASDHFSVDGLNEQSYTLRIYNAQGRLLQQHFSFTAQQRIQLSGLPAGHYTVVLSSEGESMQLPLLVK